MSLWNPFRRKPATLSMATRRDAGDPATEALARKLMVKAAKSTGLTVDKLNELIDKYSDGSQVKLEDDDPDSANYSAAAIKKLLDQGKYEEALLNANGSIDSGSNDPAIHALKINALLFLDRDEAAVEFGNGSLERWPTSVELHCVLGCANNKLKRFDRAQEHFQRALQQEPEHARSLIGLGDCLIFKKDYAGARSVYDHAISLHPIDGMAWCNRALALANLGEFRSALESVDKGIALWPEHPTAQVLRAKLKLRLAVEG